MFEVGDLLTLNNQKEYLVIDQVSYKGKNYLFLSSKDGISEVAICLYENNTVALVRDSGLFNELLDLFNKRNF